MVTSIVFGCGLTATILVALAVVGPLRKQLLELGGNAERVAFWAAFANVTVVLMPAICAMSAEPDSGAAIPPLLAIAQQIEVGFRRACDVNTDDGMDPEPVHSEDVRCGCLVANGEK